MLKLRYVQNQAYFKKNKKTAFFYNNYAYGREFNANGLEFNAGICFFIRA